MKPGCFLKSLIVGTILLGVIIYIISTKGKEWIVNPVKETLVANAFESLPEEFKKIKDSKEKMVIVQKLDSLINLVKADSVSATISFTRLEKFLERLADYSKDSVLSKTEVDFLDKLSDDIVSTKKRNFVEFEKDTVK
ncbi:MAG: hypothetical protein LCH52_08040 [Bacteroidetes bacterium]|nr:hypothetical protein [Bacteroidota bacterium]